MPENNRWDLIQGFNG